MREFKRVFSLKLLLVYVLLIAVSFGYQLFSFPYISSLKTEYQNELDRYSVMSIEDALTEIDSLNAAVDYEAAEATEEFFSVQQSRELIRNQLIYLKEYPEYLDSVHKNVIQMKGLAIFNTSGNIKFNAGNIGRTDVDFPESKEVEVVLTNTLALESFSADKISSLCVLILLIAVIMSFIRERRNALSQLVYGTPNGRKKLSIKRIGILLFTAVTGIVLIKGSSFIANIYLYGTPDFSAPVQASPNFKGFTFLMNIGQYLIFSLGVKILGAFAAGLLIWAIVSAVSHLQTAIIGAGAFLAIEYTLFTLIPDSFSIVILRFINVFAFVDTEEIALKYLNINLFGAAVRGLYISLILIPIVIGASTVFLLLHSEKAKPIQKPGVLFKLYNELLPMFSKSSARLGVLGTEFKKVLWYQKGVIVVAALLVWCFGFMTTPPANREMYDSSVSAYQAEFQGEVTSETINAINGNIAEINTWEISDIKETQLSALEEIKAEANNKIGSGLWIVNPIPFSMLNNNNTANYQSKVMLICLLSVILLCSGLFAFENQSKTNALLQSTQKGKGKLIAVKLFTAFILTVFVWLLVSTREMYLICKFTNNTEWLKAPVKSVEYFADYRLNISAGIWSLLLLFKRLLIMLGAVSVSLVISKYSKTVNKAIMLSVPLLIFGIICI